MDLVTKIKVAFGTALGIFILVLWFFGGIIGAIIGVAKNDALFAVLSLLVPGFGAIYTVVSLFQAIF